MRAGVSPRPGADVGRGEPQSRRRCWAGVSPFLPRRRRWAYLDSLESFVMALYLAEMTAKLVRSGAERFFAQVWVGLREGPVLATP